MDEIIDRVLEIIEEDLPAILTRFNTHYTTQDTKNFGKSLTLASPVAYLHGFQMSFPGLPCLMAFSDTVTPLNDSPVFEGVIPTIQRVIIEFYFRADFTPVLNRMIRRYLWALYYLARQERFRFLQPSLGVKGYALDSEIKDISINMAKIKVGQGEILFNNVRMEIDFLIESNEVDEIIGL